MPADAGVEPRAALARAVALALALEARHLLALARGVSGLVAHEADHLASGERECGGCFCGSFGCTKGKQQWMDDDSTTEGYILR